MNKTAIKNFAVWARNKLIDDITYKAGLIGVSEKGIAQPLPQSSKDLQFFDVGTKDYAQVAGKDIEQRNALVRAIQEKERASDYQTALKSVVEEVAYTWFNRLIAIRFMEVNDYLPSRIRVLSSENPAKNEPDFVTTPFDTDMEFTVAEQDKIMQLKDENKLDALFRMLFIKQCNKLHEILPELFEKTNDYTELLLSIAFTDRDGVVHHLVHDIDEDDFNVEKEGQVEIIGWMYQYYNVELKDETFALLKKNVKITKERIPAATQLFTPDWIVRYMVENSLGRLWVEGHPNDGLKENWKYYLEEAEQETDVQAQLEQIHAEYRNLNPEDIKVIDPCMGSGHILVYCFDVLMQIYESQGYTQRDAVQSILENNLFGLDIDKRAAQLAYFAVMMKARQYDRRFFSRGIQPHVYVIVESNHVDKFTVEYFCNGDAKLKAAMDTIISELHDAKEYGSILTVTPQDWTSLYNRFAEIAEDIHISRETALSELFPLVQVAEALAQKYDVVVTNPPYMGSKQGMNDTLKKYIQREYASSKSDLYAVFMDVAYRMCKTNRFVSMINQHGWMFLSSFSKLRNFIVNNESILSMIHLGTRAFEEIGGEVVQTTTFVLQKTKMDYLAKYIRLTAYSDALLKEKKAILASNGSSSEDTYVFPMRYFGYLPDNLIGYWISTKIIDIFNREKCLADIAKPRQGLSTSDNDRFLKLWFEPDIHNIGFGFTSRETAAASKLKWFPYNKGGEYRKWYGNNNYVINWQYDGKELRAWADYLNTHGTSMGRLVSQEFYYKKGLTWSGVGATRFGVRCYPAGMLFDVGANGLFVDDKLYYYLAGFLNTKLANEMIKVLNPTINTGSGTVGKLPLIIEKAQTEFINQYVKENVEIAKSAWDSEETSWDFLVHPLVLATEVPDLNGGHKVSLADCYAKWETLCEKRFSKLKANEEELNRIFIDIYGLQDELTPEVEDKDVTVRKADLGRDIHSLLSYAVGCMFGRYSLDEPGLIYAGGEWDSRKYNTFIPDKDNCIPITDEAYFEDDIVGQFVGWMKKAFGEENLEANLDFIAKALGNKGAISREVIRNYFLNDFFKDHCAMYSVTGSGKRPIYWLFDSGKQNGFKALVYMHRWNADTVGNLRVEYLHKMQHTYEREIVRMQETIDNSRDSREVSKATKRKDKLQKQLKETKDYDAKLAHIALSRIDIDLDDGVKVNYEKVQTGRDGKKMQILAKI